MAKKLTLKEKLFCQTYVSTLGNGVEAASVAYDLNKKKDWKNTAASLASENLRKPKISSYVEELLEKEGLNDAVVDCQLAFLITQHANLAVKLRAINVYNRIKGRYAPEKHEVSSGFSLVALHEAAEKKEKERLSNHNE